MIGMLFFARAFFPRGGFEIFMVSYSICLLSAIVSILGLVFDKKKALSLVALILSAIPWLFLAYLSVFHTPEGS